MDIIRKTGILDNSICFRPSKCSPCRVLYLSRHNPRGESYGAQLRALHIGRALSQIGKVTLVLASTDDISREEIEAARAEFSEIKTLKLLTNPNSDYYLYLRRNFSLGIYNSFGLTCSLNEKRNFSRWVSDSDLTWFFGLRIPSALHLNRKTCSFIDIDDISSQILNLYSEPLKEKTFLNRLKLKIQAGIWRYREAILPKWFTGIGVCSEADRDYLGAHSAIHVIPNGFPKPEKVPKYRPSSPVKIGFIGTLNYSPNSEGIHWFIRQVWPRVREQFPTAKLRLIGSGTDGEIKNEAENVEGLGYIKDPTMEIASWSMLVVPIFVGGGTRIKIAEGFSRKCPIVSTSLGAYGYGVRDGTELYIADTADAFFDACMRVIQCPEEADKMSERAWNKFLEKWTWEAIAPSVHAAANYCLRQRIV